MKGERINYYKCINKQNCCVKPKQEKIDDAGYDYPKRKKNSKISYFGRE